MYTNFRTCLHCIAAFKTEEEWEALEKCLIVKHIKKGESLLKEGEVASEVIFINKGLLRLFYTAQDKSYTTKFFTENQFASGYESFLTKTPSGQALDALEDSEILVLNYADLQFLYTNYPIFERLGRLLAEDLFIYVCRRNKILLQSPEEKYMDLLNTQPELLQRVPQYLIASFMGITPETLSRLRKRMSRISVDLDQERQNLIFS